MRKHQVIAAILLAGFTAAGAKADVWPQNVNGVTNMKHIAISLNGSNVVATANLDESPLDLINFGESHFSPANVLDTKAYNDQYGWIYEGFDVPAAGDAIWIEVESQSFGLETYEGAMRPMKASHSYDPIFSTDGSADIWRFDRMMTHNWYAVTDPGEYSATYNIYVGDELSGEENLSFNPTSVTLTWTYVPEPASALLLSIGAIIGLRRRNSTARTNR